MSSLASSVIWASFLIEYCFLFLFWPQPTLISFLSICLLGCFTCFLVLHYWFKDDFSYAQMLDWEYLVRFAVLCYSFLRLHVCQCGGRGILFISRKDFIHIFWYFIIVLYCGLLLSIPIHFMDRSLSLRVPSSWQFLSSRSWKSGRGRKRVGISCFFLFLLVPELSLFPPSPLWPCLLGRSLLFQKRCFSEAATSGPPHFQAITRWPGLWTT